ncbi:short-chain dehydrogenase reductase [Colletotrichum truncatum]|uniref:Short-chain dehydrogenase reductase n=1 Tax=Colletotrichum truncatum TaxID=5467 RepID=A0ACC3YL07_COLTU
MAASYKTEGVAFITGAGSGVGRATGFTFAASGARAVIFADIDEDSAVAAAAKSKEYATNPDYQARGYKLDVRDEAAVTTLLQKVAEDFERLDYLVNSAGVGGLGDPKVPDNDMAIFDETWNVNTRGLLVVTRAAVKIMEKQERTRYKTVLGAERELSRGSIVNVLSALAYGSVQHKVAYSASKHASLGITRATAKDVREKHIRVNAVAPGWVNTAMYEDETSRAPGMREFVQAVSPEGRPAEADEVGDVVVFLCSPASNYVNGTGILIDAGITLAVLKGL